MTDPISSPHNARVAAARKLLDTRKRAAAGLFLVEGPHAVAEALGSDRHVVAELFVTESAARRDRDLLRIAAADAITVHVVTDRVAAGISDTTTPQGIVAVVRQDDVDLPTVTSAAPKLVAVLHDIGEPGNIGAVIRTCDAAGADAVVVTGSSADPHNPKCVRATAGSLFHLPVVGTHDAIAALDQLRAAGLYVLATTVDGDDELGALTAGGALDRPTAWVFGNEAHGLEPAVAAAADRRVRIPVYGRAESLNVAAAAAICLYASAQAQRHDAS